MDRYHFIAVPLALFAKNVSTLYNVSVAQLTLAFLGAFQTTLDSRPVTRFRSTNNRGLLVYLALQSDLPFPRDVLATMFWPEESDNAARNNLRQAVYQLRKILGDLDSPDAPHLLVSRQSVQFNAASDFTLDVKEFLSAIERGDLEAAASHYHGDLLPGFTCDTLQFEEWLRLEREQLHQVALEAMSDVTQAHLQAGRLEKAQAVARQQLTLEPWREQAYRQLMQAYALAGDRANALAQYELCREQLWQELAVEPGPETVVLYEAIKTGQYGPVISEEPIQPPAKTRHNLPADTLPFIGRELELSWLASALTQEDRRLVTIIGPGGMGKTRLALMAGRQLLDHFSDGVYLVDLAPLNHPEEIWPAIAAALKYQAPDSARELKDQLLAAFSRRHLLLILDNFEHLLSGASVVNEILQMCPQVSILVTSRQRLNLVSESRYELGGLAFHDELTPDAALTYPAVKLFVDRGQRVQPNFSLSNDNGRDVIRICQRVQGMPLALILAANWLEVLAPAEIAAEIERSLEFLVADLSDLPDRQRNMQAVFERSWTMLTEDEQRVMAALSVFRGGFSREAAEEVANANLRVLLGLVNKSFLQRQSDSGRYHVHELLRQFAAQKRLLLDADDARSAHCRYFAQLMASTTRRALNFHPVNLPRIHAADRDNVSRAWDYALKQGLASELSDMVDGVIGFTNIQGIYAGHIPGQAIRALRKHGFPDTDHSMLRLRLVELGYLVEKDEPAQNQQRLLKLLPLLEENGDPVLLYWLYERLKFNSLTPVETATNPATQEWLAKEDAAALETGDEIFVKMSQVSRLWLASGGQEPNESTPEQLLELLSFFEPEYSDTVIFLGVLDSLSKYYSRVEDFDWAIYYSKLNLNRARSWQDLFWIGFTSTTAAHIYVAMCQPDRAAQALLDAIDWHLAIGQVWQTLGVLWGTVMEFSFLTGAELGVSILSMVYHHPEAIPFYRHRINLLRTRFESEMGADAFVVAWEAGKSLDFDSAVAQMRAALTGERQQ